MSSLSERMATLRENVKREAESIAQEQENAIGTLRKSWNERLSAEQSAIEGSIRALSERIAAETKEAVNAMARVQGVVMWLWSRSAIALLVWVALVTILAVGTRYFGREARSEWSNYAAAKEARERIESETAIVVDNAGRRWARVDLSQYAKDETMPSQKRPGRIYVLAENVDGSQYVRVRTR